MREFTKEEKQERIAKNVAAIIDADKTMSLCQPRRRHSHARGELHQAPRCLRHGGKRHAGCRCGCPGGAGAPDLINAGRQSVLETPGCSYTDSASAFGMIRSGYIDATVLGAFEVDQAADVANWIIPGGKQLGVGGAMDLVSGAKKVIIAMTHTSKTGAKLVKKVHPAADGEGRGEHRRDGVRGVLLREWRVGAEKSSPRALRLRSLPPSPI